MKRNARTSRRGMSASAEIAHLLMHYDRLQTLRDDDSGDVRLAQCTNQ